MFDVGQGTQDLGFRNELNVLFDCEPAVEVELEILDDDGRPTTASSCFATPRRASIRRCARRLAPDFFFHDQIYRASGEIVLAARRASTRSATAAGRNIATRDRTIDVPDAANARRSIPADSAGSSWPITAGIPAIITFMPPAAPITSRRPKACSPADMMRHILGEDLNVGCVLSWGPCWYFQKQFFEGKVSKLSTPDNLMRYDVEVSGFPSSHAGHLCLLRLNEDDYPGTTRIEEWPSWDLPVLQWGKSQGAVVGFSHSGWGLQVAGDKLPTYDMPPFDGIGANEYIVDVTTTLAISSPRSIRRPSGS